MDSLYFLASLCGVAWLVVWSLRDHEQPAEPWSPFDMHRQRPAPDRPARDGRPPRGGRRMAADPPMRPGPGSGMTGRRKSGTFSSPSHFAAGETERRQ